MIRVRFDATGATAADIYNHAWDILTAFEGRHSPYDFGIDMDIEVEPAAGLMDGTVPMWVGHVTIVGHDRNPK
jgi:hypothetical protein